MKKILSFQKETEQVTKSTVESSTNKDPLLMIKWQTDDTKISFEPISFCDWALKSNDGILRKFNYVNFSNLNRTLILFDSIKNEYVTINNEGFKLGKKLNSMAFMDSGGWINRNPNETLFKNSNLCQFSEKINENGINI